MTQSNTVQLILTIQRKHPLVILHLSAKSKTSTRTHKSSLHDSVKSRVSEEILRQTVKLETAKTKLKYAEQERELIQREASLRADKNILNMRREVDEAESGLQAVQQVQSELATLIRLVKIALPQLE